MGGQAARAPAAAKRGVCFCCPVKEFHWKAAARADLHLALMAWCWSCMKSRSKVTMLLINRKNPAMLFIG